MMTIIHVWCQDPGTCLTCLAFWRCSSSHASQNSAWSLTFEFMTSMQFDFKACCWKVSWHIISFQSIHIPHVMLVKKVILVVGFLWLFELPYHVLWAWPNNNVNYTAITNIYSSLRQTTCCLELIRKFHMTKADVEARRMGRGQRRNFKLCPLQRKHRILIVRWQGQGQKRDSETTVVSFQPPIVGNWNPGGNRFTLWVVSLLKYIEKYGHPCSFCVNHLQIGSCCCLAHKLHVFHGCWLLLISTFANHYVDEAPWRIQYVRENNRFVFRFQIHIHPGAFATYLYCSIMSRTRKAEDWQKSSMSEHWYKTPLQGPRCLECLQGKITWLRISCCLKLLFERLLLTSHSPAARWGSLDFHKGATLWAYVR